MLGEVSVTGGCKREQLGSWRIHKIEEVVGGFSSVACSCRNTHKSRSV